MIISLLCIPDSGQRFKYIGYLLLLSSPNSVFYASLLAKKLFVHPALMGFYTRGGGEGGREGSAVKLAFPGADYVFYSLQIM